MLDGLHSCSTLGFVWSTGLISRPQVETRFAFNLVLLRLGFVTVRPEWIWIRHVLSSFLFFSSGLPASPYYETTGIRDMTCLQSVSSLGFVWFRPPPSPNYESTGIRHVLSSFLFFSWFRLVRPRLILVITSRLESEPRFLFILVLVLVSSGLPASPYTSRLESNTCSTGTHLSIMTDFSFSVY